MQVLDLLLSSGVAKQDPQLFEVFHIASVSDSTLPFVETLLPDPKEIPLFALIELAARAIKQPSTAWQSHQFPQESVQVQMLPLPEDVILLDIDPDFRLEIYQTRSNSTNDLELLLLSP